MTENVANDPNRRGVCVCGQHGACRLETQEYSPAMVEGRKEGGFVETELRKSFIGWEGALGKALAAMTVLGSTLSVSGRCLLVRNEKERVNTKSKEALESGRGVLERLSVKPGSFVRDAIRSLTSGKGGK